MKAARMYGPNDVRIEEMDRPVCAPGEVIVKVLACGLCGSDIRNLTSDSAQGYYPKVWGHEIGGIIDEVSPEAAAMGHKVGDRVFVAPKTFCGICHNCRSENSTFCECGAEDDYNTTRLGGFAQYVNVSAVRVKYGALVHLPDDVPFEHVAVMEPLMSVTGCQRRMNINYRDTLLIAGAGPLGCLHAELAKIRGCKKVIMSEINEERLQGVEDFGVDIKIDGSKVDQVEEVMRLTDGVGADKVICANPSTISQVQALDMVRGGGIVSYFGGVPKGKKTEIDTNIIHYKGLWVMGQTGGAAIDADMGVELVCSGRFNAEHYLSDRVPLDQLMDAVGRCQRGEAIKIVICPWMGEE